MAEASPFRAVADGVRIAIRLTPGAQAERVQGTATEADGTAVLRVAVTAPPERGRANAALIRLLAKRWHLPKTSLALVSGAAQRRKTLHLAGKPEALLARLQSWLEEIDD
jgi:uncharacterized protein (TIGR00251 family)